MEALQLPPRARRGVPLKSSPKAAVMIAMCTRREIKASRRAVCLDERGDQPDDPDGDPDPFDVPVLTVTEALQLPPRARRGVPLKSSPKAAVMIAMCTRREIKASAFGGLFGVELRS